MVPLRVFIGGSRDQRAAAVRAFLAPAPQGPPVREVHAAAHWPFLRHVMPPIRPPVFGGPATLWLRDLHLAFPPAPAPGVRLVLTQSTYQLQRVLDALATNAAYVLVADGDDRLRPEMSGRRGPWSRIDVVDLGNGPRVAEGPPFETPDNFGDIPSSAAALLLHRATAALQHQDTDEAAGRLDEALRVDPSWEATHFELGKLWLRTEQTERAAAAFAEAGRLMPTFAAAFSNLGAALGEMERAEEALAALEQALRHDPNGFPVINNIGAVYRERGDLDRAEDAFRRVVEISPGFVFGHYNLGHTLFLQGRYAEAQAAYEAGQERDPQKNARQACRMAVARAATGDAAGGAAIIESVAGALPPEMMEPLADEAQQTLEALLSSTPDRHAALQEMLAVVRRYAPGAG